MRREREVFTKEGWLLEKKRRLKKFYMLEEGQGDEDIDDLIRCYNEVGPKFFTEVWEIHGRLLRKA